MQLGITASAARPPDELAHEIVERKGRGHPDSLCDALAENLSLALSRFYLERFGAILHHNVDKALLIGAAARPAFGGGTLEEPIEIILAGRATRAFRGVSVPVDEIAVEASRGWLARNIRNLDVERDVRIVPRIRATSGDLAELFARGAQGVPRANDTSFGVGFAPFDRLERAVLAVGEALAAAPTREAHPAIGDDVKILGLRSGGRLEMTVACAFVGRHLRDLDDYRAKKAAVASLAESSARKASGVQAEVVVNAADSAESIYLTVTGLSAEAGDDGQVGRGNRVNGLITPYRPMSLEAAAGKNPVSHTGKLYNLLAGRIARRLTEELAAVERAGCLLLSRIGTPVTSPAAVAIKLATQTGQPISELREPVEAIAADRIASIPALIDDFVDGRVELF